MIGANGHNIATSLGGCTNRSLTSRHVPLDGSTTRVQLRKVAQEWTLQRSNIFAETSAKFPTRMPHVFVSR